MPHQGHEPVQLKGPGVLALLLLIVFAAELAVSELLAPLVPSLSTVTIGLLDAIMVVCIIATPLWGIYFRRLPHAPGGEDESRPNPLTLLIKALVGIFTVEYLTMLLLPAILPEASQRVLAVIDASLVSAFLLYLFLARPKASKHSVLLMDTPLRLYFLLLCTLFLADLIQDFVVPLKALAVGVAPTRILDSLLTTLCGAPLLWFLVVQPLKRAARSEQTRVAAVHAQVIDAIVAMDPGGVIASFNPAAQRIFGYGAEEMIGRSAALLFDRGREGLEELVAGASAGSGEGAVLPREIVCRRRDGLTLIMEVSLSQVLLERDNPEFLLIMRDITSRKRMEEALRESEMRFREIFHQSEDAILFFKPGGCSILDANAKAERTFGYGKGELKAGGLELFCEPADLGALCAAIGAVAGGGRVQHDFLARRKDGARIVASMRGKVMLLQGIPVTYCSFRDITDRIRMEEKTRDIQAKLIQTNKMTSLGLLVSGVAHEINNPNNFIIANCELLSRITRDAMLALRECVEEQHGESDFYVGGLPVREVEHHSQKLLEGVAEGARRVNDIVTKLKAFARQERNQAQGKVDVNEVARSAVSLLRHELIKFTDNFHLELGEELPPVMGHGQELGQVIMNLIMNACQALPGKGSGIWLATAFDPERGEVAVSVRDEGCGMSREEGQRILEPFFTTKLDSGGTGLGLSISDSIVREHGGTLEFVSAPGEGTTFTVKLPAAGRPEA